MAERRSTARSAAARARAALLDLMNDETTSNAQRVRLLAELAALLNGLILYLDHRSLIIYTMIISSILYFQRNTIGAALISSKY